MTDFGTLHQQLRIDTARMLNYDINNLTAQQALRVDLACSSASGN